MEGVESIILDLRRRDVPVREHLLHFADIHGTVEQQREDMVSPLLPWRWT